MLRRTLLKGLGAALVSVNLFLMPDRRFDAARVYYAKDVRIFIGDVEIKGFADGGFINIENLWQASPDERVRPEHLDMEWFADSRLGVPYYQLKLKERDGHGSAD